MSDDDGVVGEPRYPFYRMQSNQMFFRLLDQGVVEDYSVWDNTNKVFLRERQGQSIVGTDNKPYRIGETKYLKREVFDQLFPNYNRKNQHIRNVIVGDVPHRFGFVRTANDKLNLVIDTQVKSGINPLEMTYILRKSGTGLSTAYEVIAGDSYNLQNVKEGVAELRTGKEQVVPPNATPIQAQQRQEREGGVQTPPPSPKMAFTGVKLGPEPTSGLKHNPFGQQVIMLTSQEKELLEAAESHPERLERDKFVNLWIIGMRENYQQNTPREHADKVYDQYYMPRK